jgi:hypothetical protein
MVGAKDSGEIALRYDRSHTPPMKTAISLPDELFVSAEALAQQLGVSRSELFANAVAELVARYDRTRLTERLNAVYGDASHEAPDVGLAVLQARSLPHDQW